MSRDVFAAHPGARLAAYRLMCFLGRRLPLWVSRLIGYVAGLIGWAIDRHGRRVVRANLAHFVPRQCPEALGRAVRRSYVGFCMSLAEGFAIPRLRREDFLANVRLVDPWGVMRAPPLRGPMILATIHCNWEMTVAYCHHLGFAPEVDAIALPHGDPAIDALFDRIRSSVGCRSLLLDRAPLASLRALRDGRLLGVVAERDYTGNGLPVRFADATMRLPIGAAALAAQTGAPIVPSLLARTGPSRFVYVVAKPILPDLSRPKQEQVAVMTQRLADVFARFIAAAPAQWVAFHDAWTRAPRPDAAPSADQGVTRRPATAAAT